MHPRVLLMVAGPIAAVALILGAALATSPYRSRSAGEAPKLATSIDVEAGCAQVFDYLANSSNASNWSVYVDHITPLNASSVPDGAKGSIRRSFRNADESGMRWDESFTDVQPARRRELRIYNVVGAPATVEAPLVTEQLYTPLAEHRCRVVFTLFFGRPPSALDDVKMRIAAHEIGRIFRRNLANISRLAGRSDSALSSR